MRKPIEFLGGSIDDLRAFPDEAKKIIGAELMGLEMGYEPADSKPIRTIGKGVRELRIRVRNQYRIIYIAKFSNAIYVLHCFVKKTRSMPKHDIDIAKSRLGDLLSRKQVV